MEWESLSDLEFDKLLNLISSYCFTEEGKKRILSIRPLTFHMKFSEAMQTISYRHSVISKARAICSRINIPSLSSELISVWRKASKEGSILSPRQIYEVYEFLRAFVELVATIDNLDEEFAILKDLIEFDTFLLYDKFSEIESSVKSAIDRDGGILRTATDRLNEIISEKEKVELTVLRILTAFINEPENEEYLQEKFVTIRNNRFVIPVKMEYVNAIEGFVQDISSTGHTAFVEPKFIQPYAIRYLELIEEEKREIARILQNITSKVGSLSSLIDVIIETIGKIDEIQALAKYANITGSERPKLSSRCIVKLIEARHPFLRNPVPINVQVGDENEEGFGGLIISGPNTSGKTVSIKTLGLLTAMALSGILIPASSSSVIGYFNKILADIGETQSIEKNLSTFSAHITKINRIVDLADETSLVILDELGTGTDPREGEALAVAILKHLSKKKAKLAVATHYSLVKKLPLSSEYFKNAYMDFDNETLKPLYRVVMGMPGSSNAILIAHKLGMRDEIIQDALKTMIEGVDIHEKFIVEVQSEKRELEKLREELQERVKEVETLKAEYKSKINDLNEKLEKVRRKEINTLLSDIYEIKSRISRIREKITSERLSQKELEEINKEVIEIYSKIEVKGNIPELARARKPKVGDRVFSSKLGREGIVSKIYRDGRVEILAGKMKMITTVEDLFDA